MKILKPADELEAAQLITNARSEGTRLEIRGNGTKRDIGNAVSADKIISASAMSGITQYDPAELVMVAKAGTLLSEIDKALAKNKQMHVFEPANYGKLFGTNGKQTIGGIAASNMSGPRRYVAGAARDSLLGVRFVNGSGEIIKNGGQVMKNVTGLDLVKLMGGSWGTLGFLTEVSFKVLPRPETQITLAIHNVSDAEGAQLMATAMATSADVTGASHAPADIASQLMNAPVKGGITFMRLEGLKETIGVRCDRVIASLPKGLNIQEIDARASLALWKMIRDVLPFADQDQRPVWRISVAPMSGYKVAAAILNKLEGQVFYDWQGGLVWLRLDDVSNANAQIVRNIVKDHGGYATLIRASEPVRASTAVFQPEIAPLAALSERIKMAMDPSGLFNVGRMSPDV
ncbi:glycolate oxidase subunit GlcE [Ahrensia kielensis]|uniref:glycolate oxidase subunit GlcE n=1 Tax=Ahrensia kielensis TaxID=76980 RepID=UPI00037E02CC|nr:glycolate oxidase subunit GlcE [Ahrensia kielensis]